MYKTLYLPDGTCILFRVVQIYCVSLSQTIKIWLTACSRDYYIYGTLEGLVLYYNIEVSRSQSGVLARYLNVCWFDI